MSRFQSQPTGLTATGNSAEPESLQALELPEIGKVLMLNPDLICPSASANRSEAEYSTAEFEKLKESVKANGGIVQPIQVRPLVGRGHAEFPLAQYEIIYGHRRHRACLDLNLSVLTHIDDASNDDDLLVRMTQENRERKALSAYETGLSYLDVMARKGISQQKQLAEFLKIDATGICEALAVANLPEEILELFPSRLALTYHDGPRLARRWAKDEEGTRRRVKIVRQMQRQAPLRKAQIVAILLGEVSDKDPIGPSNLESYVYVEDALVGVVSSTATGLTSVKFTNKRLSNDDRSWLVQSLERMLADAPFLAPVSGE